MVTKKEDQIIRVKIDCHGRDRDGNPVLDEPVEATLKLAVVRQRKISDSSTFPEYAADRVRSEIIKCPYQSGPHGEYCWASWDRERMVEYDGKTGIWCPFVVELPKDAHEVGEKLLELSQTPAV